MKRKADGLSSLRKWAKECAEVLHVQGNTYLSAAYKKVVVKIDRIRRELRRESRTKK